MGKGLFLWATAMEQSGGDRGEGNTMIKNDENKNNNHTTREKNCNTEVEVRYSEIYRDNFENSLTFLRSENTTHLCWNKVLNFECKKAVFSGGKRNLGPAQNFSPSILVETPKR